jgi:hypothetical protein
MRPRWPPTAPHEALEHEHCPKLQQGLAQTDTRSKASDSRGSYSNRALRFAAAL